MKRSILFMILIALFASGKSLAADNPIDLTKETPPPYPRIREFLPVSATISDIDLAIYFETSIGEATVTVTDDLGQTVYQESVDTDSTSEMHIPVDLWTSGDYTLIITYDSTVLRGNFQVE